MVTHDNNLMGRLDPDNSDTFIRLLIPNQKSIFAYILAVIPNYSDAEDILQNTISVIWRKFSTYQPGTDFQAWAIQIARCEIYNFFKKNPSGQCTLNEQLLEVIEQESGTMLDGLEQRLAALKECVVKLNSQDRQLIKLRYEQDCTLKAISSRLGISTTAVFKRIAIIHGRLVRCVRMQLALE
jgi:RNA polymerase sigma-70 factor (ECF subfamily)